MKNIKFGIVFVLLAAVFAMALTGCRGQTSKVKFNYVLNDEGTEYSVRSAVGYANGIAPEIPATYKKKPVTKVGGSGFRGAACFIKIVIPDTIKEIGNDAFTNCYGLTIILKGLTPPAQDDSFGGIYGGVKAIVVPASAVDAYKTAWAGYAGKIYSDALITDGDFLVSESGTLISYFGGSASVNVPETVTDVSARAFVNNELLKEISLGASVKTIDTDGFNGCAFLKKVEVNGQNTAFASQDGLLYSKDKSKLLLIPTKLEGEVTLPDGLTQTGMLPGGTAKKYFAGTNITAITFPAGFTRIVGHSGNESGSAFLQGCSKLTSVTLAPDLDYIGANAFSGCYSLKSITIPASVKTIGANAFGGCSKLTITVPFAESEKPDGWAEDWHGGCTVNWGA